VQGIRKWRLILCAEPDYMSSHVNRQSNFCKEVNLHDMNMLYMKHYLIEHVVVTIFSDAHSLRPVTVANIDDFAALFCTKLGADGSVPNRTP
jgi:hypothetical protein